MPIFYTYLDVSTTKPPVPELFQPGRARLFCGGLESAPEIRAVPAPQKFGGFQMINTKMGHFQS